MHFVVRLAATRHGADSPCAPYEGRAWPLPRLVRRHRLLLFRGQQNVSEGRHREIAGWWRGRGGSIKFLNVSNTQGVGVRGGQLAA